MNEVTRILRQIESGDPSSSDQLLPLVYQELRRLAASRLANEQPGQTLQATALVHEAYLRLLGNDSADQTSWNSRGHFFGAAAEAMRRILIESARRRKQFRRGGDRIRVELEEGAAISDVSNELLSLDEALAILDKKDPLAAQVVKLRYFAGLKMQDVANSLGVSLRTAERNWTYARTWLRANIAED
ncbi:MAG: sigma-70 family RNA polymerase sigma factor [Planctomycetales bacterium]|nr:sigma-70 family RNA polymerase sigma factor [Planctomycetales bacterium]MCA9167239.1 sigma-70 family RNA polymerase sigma factor [Planctomycetales bacterium]